MSAEGFAASVSCFLSIWQPLFSVILCQSIYLCLSIDFPAANGCSGQATGCHLAWHIYK